MKKHLKSRLLATLVVVSMLISTLGVSISSFAAIILPSGTVANTSFTSAPPSDPNEYAAWKELQKPATKLVKSMVMAPATMSTALIGLTSIPTGYINGIMQNEYLGYLVGSDGRYNIGTTGGDHGNPNDDNKKLLFGYPGAPWSSFTTVKLDGQNYQYVANSMSPLPDPNNLSTTSMYTNGNVTVKEIISIVNNTATNRNDTVQIKYIITNNDPNASHNAGLRIMMDTMLGDNDSAPFRVPGIGAVTTGLELSGSDIPAYWQAFNSLTSPSVVAQGSLLNTQNKPDKVQFANWSNAYSNYWMDSISNSYIGDSAVCIYWNPNTILPNESKEYITYYGLSQLQQDLTPPLALSVTGDLSANANAAGNNYTPNPFTVTAYVTNVGSGTANNVKTRIILPESGLYLGTGETQEKLLNSIAPQGETQCSWNIKIAPSTTAKTLTYYIAVDADGVATKTLTRTMTIPALNLTDEQIKTIIDGWDRYNKQITDCSKDPVDLATGNLMSNKTDIVVDGFTPIAFSRYYSSLDNFNGSLGHNWHHNYEYKLTKSGNTVTVLFGDGHIEYFNANGDGTYAPMPGRFSTLVEIPSGFLLTMPDKKKYTFSANGNLSSINDIKGNQITLTYANVGNLTKVENACGALNFEYSGAIISKITDNAGRTVEYTYSNGNLAAFKDVEGNIYSYEYDAQNRLIKLIDPLRNVTIQNVYDDKNRATKQTMGDGSVNQMSYDDANKITTMTERNGTQIIYKFDDKYRIYEKDYINGAEKTVFDAQDQIISSTDKNGNITTYEQDTNGNVTKTSDALGQITQYAYDLNNKVTSIINPDGSKYLYIYDSAGNMMKATDPLGRILDMEYNAEGLPVKITLPNGNFSQIAYDLKGNPIKVKDPAGNTSNFKYDDLNRVIQIIKPLGNKTTFEYTPKGMIKRVTNPDGTTNGSNYDAKGQLIQETDQAGHVTGYQYNSMGRMTQKTDAAGGVTKYEYDSMWNVSKVTKPDGSEVKYNYNATNLLESTVDENGKVTAMQYDNNGNLLKQTDPRGNATQNSYDSLNRLTQTVNANNAATSYQYRYDGKIRKVVDALNTATEFTYDVAGQLTSVKDALNATTSYTYNNLGLVKTVTNANGAVTRYEYNPNGKVTREINPDNSATLLDYDQNGNLIKVTDAKGAVTQYVYDSMDRLSKIIDVKGGTKRITYTENGKVASIIDENGNKTAYGYDALDRLVSVIEAKGNKTSYVYDSVGNLTEVHRFGGISQTTINGMKLDKSCNDKNTPKYAESSNEIVIKYEYDKIGQLTKEINPANKVMLYNYDQNGNLISKTDRDNLTTMFEYDAVNNLMKVNYVDGKSVQYDYNLLNQVIGMKDWLGNNTYELDALGRIIKAKNYENKLLQYQYTPIGMKKAITYPDGSSVKYEYDNMDRLTKVVDGQNKNTNYKYDVLGNVIEKDIANGYKTYYKYDELSRLIKFANADASTKIVDSYIYTYDAAGNKVSSDKNGDKASYEYDALNQLAKVTKPSGIQPNICDKNSSSTMDKYFYDNLGNRVRLESWKNNKFDSAIDYSYDNLDRLLNVTGKGVTVPGDEEILPNGMNMQYDQRGNMTKITSKDKVIGTYEFDATNKMVSAVNKKGEKSTFVYDGAGRRVQTSYQQNLFCNIKKTNSMKYLNDVTKPYDNVLMIESAESTGVSLNSSCKFTSKDILEQKFTYGLDMLSVDETEKNADLLNVLSKCKSADRSYYLQDELGSPIKIVDERGKVQQSYNYDVFGRPVQAKFGMKCDRADNVFSYTGYQYDVGTGLMHAQARYYWADVGRFVSADKFKGKITKPITQNQYAYCENKPMNFVDPSGYWDYRVHQDVTEKIAKEELGVLGVYAEKIAKADNETDYDLETTPFIPSEDNWSWHFNTNTNPNGIDTRIQHAIDCLQKSIQIWKDAEISYYNDLKINNEFGDAWIRHINLIRENSKNLSLKMLGRGLHALQDIDAHMGFPISNSNLPHHEGTDANVWKTFDEPCVDFIVYNQNSYYYPLDTMDKYGYFYGFQRDENGLFYSYSPPEEDIANLYGISGGLRYQNTVIKTKLMISMWLEGINN